MDKIIVLSGEVFLCFDNGKLINSKSKVFTWYKRKPTKRRRGGYLSTSVNGKTVYQHRIIALAFIPNPDNKPCVNHINGDASDNRIENLEWCTYLENNQHAHDTRLNGRRKDIVVTHIQTGNRYYFTSLKQAITYTKQNRSSAQRFLNGLYKNPKTYNYKYQQEQV